MNANRIVKMAERRSAVSIAQPAYYASSQKAKQSIATGTNNATTGAFVPYARFDVTPIEEFALGPNARS